MPLQKGTSDETVSENISEMVNKWERTGSIGTSTPDSKKEAQDQATRIALESAGKSKYTGDMANHPPVTEMLEEWQKEGYPAMGSRPIAVNQEQQIDQGMDQISQHEPQPAQAGHETVTALREDPAHYQVSGMKADPIEVAYRWADSDQQCGNCLYFNSEERSCSKVEGMIHPDAVCDLWEAVPSFQTPEAGDQAMQPNYSAYEINLARSMFGANFAAEKAPVGGVEVQGTSVSNARMNLTDEQLAV